MHERECSDHFSSPMGCDEDLTVASLASFRRMLPSLDMLGVFCKGGDFLIVTMWCHQIAGAVPGRTSEFIAMMQGGQSYRSGSVRLGSLSRNHRHGAVLNNA
jgi:hypothetical protein